MVRILAVLTVVLGSLAAFGAANFGPMPFATAQKAESCPTPAPEIDQTIMAPGTVLLLRDTFSEESTLVWGRVCVMPGITVPAESEPIPGTHVVVVESGTLEITVTEIGPDGFAKVYGEGLATPVATGTTPIILEAGDTFAFSTIKATIRNPSTTEPVTFVASGMVDDVSGPTCGRNCWIP